MKKKKNSFLLLLFLLIMFTSCGGRQEKPVEIDFSPEVSNGQPEIALDSLPVLSVAVAPVISPRESFVFYKELFDYMGERLNMKVEFKQRMSYSDVNNMLERNMVDMAFICTGSYTEASDGMDLLVTPVVKGNIHYYAYVITHVSSEIQNFRDLEGKDFAYTDSLSTTGKIYPLKRIMELNEDTATFFNNIVYSSSHDVSIQMVSRDLIDGASVSSLIFDYLEETQPEMIRNVRIVEKSEPYGVPPIVSSLLLDPAKKQKIQQLFLNMHQDARGREILDKLLIDRFEIMGDSLYDNIRQMSEAVWQ